MIPVYHEQEMVKELVGALIPHLYGRGVPKNSTAIGVATDDGLIVGGFVYHDHDTVAGLIEITGASVSKRWLTRDTLYALFSYPFEQLQCQMVFMKCMASDTALGRILMAYGFEPHPIERMFGRGKNGVIYTLTVEAWKANGFHKENANGQT
jgi:RimJ/RimL family protein N-acetyltransferase